jgi:hypothetical protein
MVDDTTAVTTVSAVDPDTGEGLSYFIAGGVDQNAFQIDALTGALSFKSPPDDDAPTDSDHNNSYVVQIGVSRLSRCLLKLLRQAPKGEGYAARLWRSIA